MTTQSQPLTKEYIRTLLETSDKALMRGILAIYERQTADEQTDQTTRHLNGMGFNGRDAEFLSSIAKQLGRGRVLSAKQIDASRKCMLKYAGQLLIVAQEKAAAKTAPAADPAPAPIREGHSAVWFPATMSTPAAQRYSAEMSDLQANHLTDGQSVGTPFGILSLSEFVADRDDDNDIRAWVYTDGLNRLTIFND